MTTAKKKPLSTSALIRAISGKRLVKPSAQQLTQEERLDLLPEEEFETTEAGQVVALAYEAWSKSKGLSGRRGQLTAAELKQRNEAALFELERRQDRATARMEACKARADMVGQAKFQSRIDNLEEQIERLWPDVHHPAFWERELEPGFRECRKCHEMVEREYTRAIRWQLCAECFRDLSARQVLQG